MDGFALGQDGQDRFGKAGNLYGTTIGGYHNECDTEAYCGSVFKLSPSKSGWQFKASI